MNITIQRCIKHILLIPIIFSANIPAWPQAYYLAPPGFHLAEKKVFSQAEKDVLAWRQRTANVKPFATMKEMLNALKNNKHVWDRVLKNEKDLRLLLFLFLREVNKKRKNMPYFELSDINTAHIQKNPIPEIGKCLTGLLVYSMGQTEEQSSLAGLRFIMALAKVELSRFIDKPYKSIDEMVRAIKKKQQSWARIVQNDEHVLFLLNLLLYEMNKGRSESKLLNLSDIKARDMWRIQIEELDASLFGLLRWYKEQTEEKTPSAGIQRMRDTLNIKPKVAEKKPYPSFDAMIKAVKGKDPDWERVMQNNDHVMYLLDLLLEQLNTGKPESQWKKRGGILGKDMEVDIKKIGKSLRLLLRKYADKTDTMKESEGLKRMKEELHIKDINAEPYASIDEMMEAIKNDEVRWSRVFSSNEHLLYLLNLLLNEMNTDRQEPNLLKLSDINTRNMIDISIPEIDKPLSGLLNFLSKKSKRKTQMAGVILLMEKLGVKHKHAHYKKRKSEKKKKAKKAHARRVEPFVDMTDTKVCALLELIYKSKHKKRNIDIYIMHRKGLNSREIRVKLKKNKNILLGTANILYIVKKIIRELENYQLSLNSGAANPIKKSAEHDRERSN